VKIEVPVPEPARVDDLDRVVERRRADHAQHGPEDLLLGDLHLGRDVIENRRPDERPLWIAFGVATIEHDGRPALLPAIDPFPDPVAGARVVKAANTLGAEVLGSDPHEAGGQRVIFISGDDADAKADVVALFQDAGFAAIDLGDLATGGAMQQIHHPLAGVNLIRL